MEPTHKYDFAVSSCVFPSTSSRISRDRWKRDHALSYSAILAVVYGVFRYALVDVFAPPEGDFSAIREISAFMMVGLACYVMADAVIIVAGGILRGAGDTRWIMVASVSLHWAMLVAQFLIISVFGLGPRISWIVAWNDCLASPLTSAMIWSKPVRAQRSS